MMTSTIEKPALEVVAPTPSKTRSSKPKEEEDLSGVMAIIYRPERDKTVPSQIGLVPSIRQESLIYNLEEVAQHSDLVNRNRAIPACETLTLRVGTNWVDRQVWALVKEGNAKSPGFTRKISTGVFDEKCPGGEPMKSLASYEEADAIDIVEATWSEEDVNGFKVDEKRPLVLQKCETQLRQIASQYKKA